MKRLILVALLVGTAIGYIAVRAIGSTPVGTDRSPAAFVQSPAAPAETPAGTRETPARSSALVPAAALCDPDLLLAAVVAAGPAPEGLYWASVEVANCRNGYARVWAITGGTPPPGIQLEGSEQVFLKDVGGTWQVFTSGSGLDCVSEPLGPDMKEACEALGLH
ncbi:MAG: hypothetical protein E6G47_12400 [Actinobacteria bacterium]|nr:MAG: hypothetical protein E6G47_12400 [Actinomycetota bacterium]